MTAKEFAEKIDKPYRTVIRWLREGLVPGAEHHSVKGAGKPFWVIPPSAVKKFEPPKIGRPTKNGKK